MTKIGLMSFAHLHAFSYAACLKELAGVEFTALWDDDPKRGKAMAAQYQTNFIGDRAAFFKSGIEGVIICSENVKHREMVEAAAAAGKWVLCEKPLAPTVEDARAMVAACRKAKVGLGTAFPCRFVPALVEARNQIQAGEFGEILAASCTNHGQYPGGWFSNPNLSGGGATMDHTVHVADVLRWILGKEFTTVYCELGNQVHPKQFDADDLGSLHLEMEGGVQVSHLASWSRPKSFPTWGDVTIEFIGTNGVLYVDGFNQKLDVYSDSATRAEWAYWGTNCDLGLVSDFVQSIRDKRTPLASGEDGVKATEVTVAAYKSAKAGKRIDLLQD